MVRKLYTLLILTWLCTSFAHSSSKDRNIQSLILKKIDHIVKKKHLILFNDPWTIQGLPMFFWTRNSGFNLGAIMKLSNIRKQNPDLISLEAQILASDKSKANHFIRVSLPRLIENKLALYLTLRLMKKVPNRFFGIGNNPNVDNEKALKYDPIYQSEVQHPEINLQFLYHLTDQISIGPVIGLRSTEVIEPVGSLLSSLKPLGHKGGNTNFVGFGLTINTTNNQHYPKKGSFYELYGSYYADFLKSDYDFTRITAQASHFAPLSHKLIFGHRTLIEALPNKKTPYYEMNYVGGFKPKHEFCGSDYLRGFYDNQFSGHYKWVTSLELRYMLASFKLFKKIRSEIGLKPFIDIGKVWLRTENFNLDKVHMSGGLGLQGLFDKRLYLRLDTALSHQGLFIHAGIGKSF